MKYQVQHASSYRYADPVDLSSHMLHLLPRELPFQQVLSARLEVTPAPARQQHGVDHFGNRVVWLSMDLPHEAFEVVSHAVVDVHYPPPPDASSTLAWERLAGLASGANYAAAEFLFDSPMGPINAAAREYVGASFPPGRPALEGLVEVMARIGQDFRFRAGVTTISTPVEKVLEQRAGVCQDFTNLMIAGLRGLGVPARYVSGYIRTRPPPGAARRRGADQSHAWVGCWLGPEHGWVDLDPTNNIIAKDEHVVVAWGRDYGDISPVIGVLLGGGRHSLSVSVDLEEV